MIFIQNGVVIQMLLLSLLIIVMLGHAGSLQSVIHSVINKSWTQSKKGVSRVCIHIQYIFVLVWCMFTSAYSLSLTPTPFLSSSLSHTHRSSALGTHKLNTDTQRHTHTDKVWNSKTTLQARVNPVRPEEQKWLKLHYSQTLNSGEHNIKCILFPFLYLF